MMSEESREFTQLRRDQEDAEKFKASKFQNRRRFWVDPQMKESNPRERD
ncbi:hypothetical protein CCP3SC15_1980006 [Gammaproteobacteria bacterium]